VILTVLATEAFDPKSLWPKHGASAQT
jgi:uncharacterized paraquat-inducible protein A